MGQAGPLKPGTKDERRELLNNTLKWHHFLHCILIMFLMLVPFTFVCNIFKGKLILVEF